MEINRDNYETFFLLYMDAELNPSERKSLEKFLRENTDLQKEFDDLAMTIQIPSAVVFDQKEILYRKEEKRRVIPVYWLRIAAVIMLILAGGWWVMTISGKKEAEALVSNRTSQKRLSAEEKNKYADIPLGQLNTEQRQWDAPVKEIPKSRKSVALNQAPKVRREIPQENTGDSQGLQDQQQDPVSEEITVAKPKSMEGFEIRSGAVRFAQGPKQITVLAAAQTPQLALTVEGEDQNLLQERESSIEPDFQTENSISVVALNDKNKSITGILKKLTASAPEGQTANTTRKLRISVFQFSY